MSEDKFYSGFVCLAGKPNVGKSTLLNCLVGEKIAIVSNKPQTTRNKIRAVLTKENSQVIFIDTPGIHKPGNKLGDFMVKSAQRGLDGVDVILFLVEPERPRENDRIALEAVKQARCPVFLVINKIDTIEKQKLLTIIDIYREMHQFDEIIPISALTGENTELLGDCIYKALPEGPMYYAQNTLTDQPEKQIAAELIREKALRLLDKEIPHGIAVSIDLMRKRENKELVDIQATIFCERKSHKQIIIGAKGSMLKKIGMEARKDIENLLGSPIYLELWVKIKKNWRDNDFLIKNFGYDAKNI